MNKKLTLSINEELIDFARSYTKTTKQSISHLFEVYLERLKNEISQSEFAAESTALYGILKDEEIPEKHQLRKDFYEKSSH